MSLEKKLDIISRNTGRLGKVWMGDFYKFLVALNPSLNAGEVGDISDRVTLKEKLKYEATELNYLKKTSRGKLPLIIH